MKKHMILVAVTIFLVFSAFIYSEEYTPVENPAALEVSFSDPAWDGVTVPEGQQCQRFGGNGSSPALSVENIPAGANALIVSFSDRTFKPNDNGGHGIVGLWISENQSSAAIPSVPGETIEMPEGMFIESQFRSNRGSAGAYLPPCSGGRGNEYYATVTAVYIGESSDEESLMLGEGVIEMGRY